MLTEHSIPMPVKTGSSAAITAQVAKTHHISLLRNALGFYLKDAAAILRLLSFTLRTITGLLEGGLR